LVPRLKKEASTILVLEGLPCFSGVFMAEELKEEGLKVLLACDLMAGFFFGTGMIERVYLGIDPSNRESLIKGGALISLLAQAYRIPIETFEANLDPRPQGAIFSTFGASSLEGKVPVFFGEPYERL
jgi:methylthioribose-1-phosphate isomerase